jgi:hypothetical protein
MSDFSAREVNRRIADSMAEREGFEPAVPVHLCFALLGAQVAGFSGKLYHQLSREDVRIEFAQKT